MIFRHLLSLVITLFCIESSYAEHTLKIGVLGAMSGPAKYWGLTNKYCAQATAKMYNDKGGIKIGGSTYKIEIFDHDTRLDPQEAIAGAKKLIEQHQVSFIIGPNIDDTSLAIIPILEANNTINFSYGFSEKLYAPPRQLSYLGMMHPRQSAPAIYQHLKNKHRIKSVSFLARYDKEALNQRNLGIEIARSIGLEVKDVDAWDIKDITYDSSQSKLIDLAKRYSELKSDLIVLSGGAPEDIEKIIQLLRESNYQGFIGTETAQDPSALLALGLNANKLVTLGSTPPPDSHSAYMKEFIDIYSDIAGQWQDEAGVKVYALEFILRVLEKTGSRALTNSKAFILAAKDFSIKDPLSRKDRTLRLAGKDIFGQNQQINVPLTIITIDNGKVTSDTY